MNLRNLVPGSLLALSLLIGAGSLATHARDDQNAGQGRQAALNGMNVAVVDMKRVYDASDEPRLLQEKAAETYRELQQQQTRIAGVPYLDQQELAEFINILTTANPTPVQQARLDTLKGLSDARAQEMDALQHKAVGALNADDKQRMKTLQESYNRLQTQLQSIGDLLSGDRQSKLQDYQAEQMNRLRGVVGKLAASRGILHVFSATALVYSVNDITNDVIQKVGKHK